MKVAVAGGGWYGCHIASSLKAHGVEVTLLEKNEQLFGEASGNNQFRLHQGLHYARSAQTRHQSRDGYHRFVERYPRLSQAVASNIYLVPRETSLIDFETYFSIMLSSGIAVEKVPLSSIECIDASRFEGAVRCDERVVLTGRARDHFAQRLNGSAHLDRVVRRVESFDDHVRVDGERHDHFIDATWGAFGADLPGAQPVFYEPTLLLYYRYRGGCGSHAVFPAVTLVDGTLWSIYPTDDPMVYTLSSVRHTPIGQFDSKAAAYACLAEADSALVARKRAEMEAEVAPYLPAFTDLFEFVGPQFAIKTKPRGLTDNRACGVEFHGRRIRVQSGKIDNIFFATDRILGALVSD
ncbi:MAG: FAD-dependent oxidoreductase [Leptothrix sp. (in: b-proteobacteria)]